MWKDPIVEEIHKYRDEYAKQFDYDIHAICQDIRKKQGQDGQLVVSLSPNSVKYAGVGNHALSEVGRNAVPRTARSL